MSLLWLEPHCAYSPCQMAMGFHGPSLVAPQHLASTLDGSLPTASPDAHLRGASGRPCRSRLLGSSRKVADRQLPSRGRLALQDSDPADPIPLFQRLPCQRQMSRSLSHCVKRRMKCHRLPHQQRLLGLSRPPTLGNPVWIEDEAHRLVVLERDGVLRRPRLRNQRQRLDTAECGASVTPAEKLLELRTTLRAVLLRLNPRPAAQLRSLQVARLRRSCCRRPVLRRLQKRCLRFRPGGCHLGLRFRPGGCHPGSCHQGRPGLRQRPIGCHPGGYHPGRCHPNPLPTLTSPRPIVISRRPARRLLEGGPTCLRRGRPVGPR